MWRINWNLETWHTFDTQQELIDWVKATAGTEWYQTPFEIQEQIDGEWTTPSLATNFS
jgi:hypothetical protein